MMYNRGVRCCKHRQAYSLKGANMTPITEYRTIPLTQGQVALVSLHRYDELSRYKWHARWSKRTKSYYAKRNSRIGGKHITILMHRSILGLEFGDVRLGDHANLN